MFALFLVVAVFGTALDLWSKSYVFDSLGAELDPAAPERFQPGESYVIIEGMFDFSCAVNFGVAFSQLRGKTGLIIGFSFLAMLLVCWMQYKLPEGAWGRSLALGAIISGALGNVYDRLTYGVVRDFIHCWYQDWHYPTFNVADMAIVIGAVVIILAEFGRKEPDKDASSFKDKPAAKKKG